jgi:hypothetical protein
MSKVVAKKILLNQTALIAEEAIFTSQEGGDFALWIYGGANSASVKSGSLAIAIQWQDGLVPAEESGPIASWESIGKNSFSQPVLVHLAPGASISISTTGTAPPAGSFYNLYLTVQELFGPGF